MATRVGRSSSSLYLTKGRMTMYNSVRSKTIGTSIRHPDRSTKRQDQVPEDYEMQSEYPTRNGTGTFYKIPATSWTCSLRWPCCRPSNKLLHRLYLASYKLSGVASHWWIHIADGQECDRPSGIVVPAPIVQGNLPAFVLSLTYQSLDGKKGKDGKRKGRKQSRKQLR
jgi:hypothetical protein